MSAPAPTPLAPSPSVLPTLAPGGGGAPAQGGGGGGDDLLRAQNPIYPGELTTEEQLLPISAAAPQTASQKGGFKLGSTELVVVAAAMALALATLSATMAFSRNTY